MKRKTTFIEQNVNKKTKTLNNASHRSKRRKLKSADYKSSQLQQIEKQLTYEVDVDINNISFFVFRLVNQSTPLGTEPNLLLLIMEYLAKRDPLELFLSSGAFVFRPNYFISKNVFQKEFRKFVQSNKLRDASVSISVYNSRVQNIFEHFNCRNGLSKQNIAGCRLVKESKDGVNK